MTPRGRLGQPWARLAAGLIPAFVLAIFLTNGSISPAIRVEAALVLAVTLVRPAVGLMIVAFLAPLGDIVVPIVGGPPLRHAETLTVAFLSGWLLFRTSDDKSRVVLPSSLTNAMWVFGGVLISSVAATAFQLHRENPTALRSAFTTLTQSYLLNADDVIGVHAAGRLLEGLGLMAAAAEIGQRNVRDRIPLLACLVASGVVASIASVLLAMGIAPVQTLARHAAVGLARYSAVAGDVNAAASSYLLLVGVSLGIATLTRPRAPWLLAGIMLIGGLALTSSGATVIAFAAVVCAAGFRWISLAASRSWKTVTLVFLVLALAGAITFTRSARSMNSLEMRVGFTQASVRLIEASPVFGVGAGRYYPLSKLVLPPWLSQVYGRENAHNFYLQMTAELGIVGILAFLVVLGAALTAALKRSWLGQAGNLTVACTCAVFAYLITALSGHPFLVLEAMVPFWIVLGLLVTPQDAPTSQSRWPDWAALGITGAILLTVPLRGARLQLPSADFGFGRWQTDDGGRRFREAEAISSLSVDPAATSVEVPIRLRGGRPADSAVASVTVPGFSRTDTRISGEWAMQLVALPGAEVLEPYQRINVAITPIPDGAPEHDVSPVEIGQVRIVSRR
jgi:O-antigen ligase